MIKGFDIISHCAVMELYLKAFRANLDVGVGFLQDRATVSSFILDNLGSSFLTILYNLKPYNLLVEYHKDVDNVLCKDNLFWL